MPSKTKTPESCSTLDNKLRPHQDELLQLGELAGIYMDPKVFRILVELLNMGVDPNTISRLLSTVQKSSEKHKPVGHHSSSHHRQSVVEK